MVTGTSYQQTRDNFQKTDNTRDLVLIGVFNEDITIEEGATVLRSRDLTGRGIWGIGFGNGTDSNGKWGEAGYTWGADPVDDTYVWRRVVNPQNVFRERFRYDTFNDATVTTADFSTTYYNVSFTEGEVFQTKQIFQNDQAIRSVTIHVDISYGSTEFIVSGDYEDVKTITVGQ